jgi:hypothetical protein
MEAVAQTDCCCRAVADTGRVAEAEFSEAQRRAAIYEVLDLSSEDAYGLWEFKDQPREAFVEVLLELIGRGLLLVLAPDGEVVSSGVGDATVARSLLCEHRSWEPSVEQWASGSCVALLATDDGKREYRSLAAERFGSG